jgi:hypothetical protein
LDLFAASAVPVHDEKLHSLHHTMKLVSTGCIRIATEGQMRNVSKVMDPHSIKPEHEEGDNDNEFV